MSGYLLDDFIYFNIGCDHYLKYKPGNKYGYATETSILWIYVIITSN